MLKKSIGLTDEQVELEIERLLESPLVKLAKKEESVRYRRRQYLTNFALTKTKERNLPHLV